MLQSVFEYFNSHRKVVKRIQYILIALFLFLIAFDIYLAVTDSSTISNVIKEKTDNGFFVLTYFWGAIAANLFVTRQGKPWINGTAGSILVIGIALIIVIFDVDVMVDEYMVSHDYKFSRYSLSMLLGLIIGITFWRQQHPIK